MSDGYLASPCSARTRPSDRLHCCTVVSRTRYHPTSYRQILLLTVASCWVGAEPPDRYILLYGCVAPCIALQYGCAFADATCTHHDHVQEAVPRADGSRHEHLVPSDVDASAFPPTKPVCSRLHQPERLRLCFEATVSPAVNGSLVQRLHGEIPFRRSRCSNPAETVEF